MSHSEVRGVVLGTTGGSPRVQDHREWERLGGVMREAGLKSVQQRWGAISRREDLHVCIFSQEKNKHVEPMEIYHARHTLIEGFT